MKTQTLFVISAAITAVLAYPTEDSDYTNYQGALTFPCGDTVSSWVAEVGFGTPEQKSSLLIDTSSSETWTAGIMCHDEFCTSRKDPLYHAGKSSTSKKLHKKRHLDYGDGKLVDGELYEDELQFGNAHLNNFEFVKATSVQGFDCDVDYSGILGLGGSFNNETESSALTKRRVNRYNSVAIGPRRSSFKRSLEARKNVGKLCELSIGIDKNAFSGDIAWLDLPTCDYGESPFWKTELSCIKIDGVVDFKFDKTLASFETSVKFIEAPHDDIAQIHAGLGATYNEESKQYEFECCNAKDLQISFKKFDVTIPVSAWTTPTEDDGKICTAKIAVSTSDTEPRNKWQLGTSFIENFYTVFSYDRLKTGLALPVNGVEGVKITAK